MTLALHHAGTEAHSETTEQATAPGGDWRHRARCRPNNPDGIDPDLFFPVAQTGPLYDAQVREAKQECFKCPVAKDCLAWALDTDQVGGVAGGMTPEELRSLKRRMTPRSV